MVLLCADWVLPISDAPLARGAVLVTEPTIGAVGPAAELRARYPEQEVREFPGCVLLPGLVNPHTHLDYSAFRGFTRSSRFGPWMFRLLLASRKLREEDYAASALWGAHECARGGVTTIADASARGWTVARAVRDAGLRARVYLEVFGLDDAELPKVVGRLQSRLDRLEHEFGEAPAETSGCSTSGVVPRRVEWGVSPHAPYTVPPRLYREVARFARRNGLRMVTHVAESQAEVELLTRGASAIAGAYKAAHLWKRRHWKCPGLSPVQYVAHAGVLGPDMLVVHAVQVDGIDIATLAESGTAVAHCPRSNVKLRCGAAPVSEMRAAGITVGLGTDSLASNDSLDMFAEMRAALAVSRERAAAGARSAPLTPRIVLRMATLDGAAALGWGHLVGSLEVGKRADLIAVRCATGEPSAVHDSMAALVENADSGDVVMTMIDGVVASAGSGPPPDVVEGLSAARAKLGLATA